MSIQPKAANMKTIINMIVYHNYYRDTLFYKTNDKRLSRPGQNLWIFTFRATAFSHMRKLEFKQGIKEDFLKLKEMIENEFVLARAAVFTDSLFHGFSTFGSKMFSYDNLLNEYEEEPLVRKGKAILHEENASCETEEHKAEKVVYGKPSDFAPQQYNNDKIIMSDIINIPLWDISEWCGSYFLIYPNYPPILSLVFRNESGLKIFDEWKQKYGNDVDARSRWL